MSHEYSRGKARHTAALAAPSAFGYDEAPVSHHTEQAEHSASSGTHYMAGDESKIFNPKTGKYVKIDGKIGQEIIDEFGYPTQQGGYSLSDLNNQLSQSFSDLYDSLSATWNSLTGSYDTSTSPKASMKSSKSSAKTLEQSYVEPKPRRRNNRRRNVQVGAGWY